MDKNTYRTDVGIGIFFFCKFNILAIYEIKNLFDFLTINVNTIKLIK